MAPIALIPEPIPEVSAPRAKYQDWRADLQANGYAVIKEAIPRERAIAYQKKAFDWLRSFGTDLDLDDPTTWDEKNLPVQSKINTFSNYGVPHEKFMWDARLEPAIVDAFAKVWGTEELLVSFDALNITFPNRKDRPKKERWEHLDQSPLRRGMHCVQGVINLSHSGPEDGGLLVYPGSHLLNDEFMDSRDDENKAEWSREDRYMFTEEELEWFAERGVHPHKVCAEPGDLLLWDSRTIHQGVEPEPSSNTIRTVIYAAYTPARLASKEVLEKKAGIFKRWGGTNHWPHDNITERSTEAKFDDGTVDPKSRTEPIEKPELTDQLLKLAGVKPY